LKSYRIYIVGPDGKYVGLPKFVECADDEEALAHAFQPINKTGIAVEIWEAARIVAWLPRLPTAKGSKKGR
jgi:hypothetical protein